MLDARGDSPIMGDVVEIEGIVCDSEHSPQSQKHRLDLCVDPG